jgi:hypothetical protein
MSRIRKFNKLSEPAKQHLLLIARQMAESIIANKKCRTDVYGLAVQFYPRILRREDFSLIEGKSEEEINKIPCDWRKEIAFLCKK